MAYTTWEARGTTGDDLNAGGFRSDGVTDYSQQAAAQLSLSDLVTDGTAVVTSVVGGFTAAMVGNWVQINGGTGALSAVLRYITVFTDGNTVTLNATVAISVGASIKVGGALKTLATIGAVMGTSDIAHMTGNVTINVDAANVAAGRFAPASAVGGVVGYGAARFDGGTKPIVTMAAPITGLAFYLAGGGWIENISVACGNVGSGIRILNGTIKDCYVTNWIAGGLGFQTNGTGSALVIGCEAASGAARGYLIRDNGGGGNHRIISSIAHDCANIGIELAGGAIAINCISYLNTGASGHGIVGQSNMCCIGCTTYGNSQDGYRDVTVGSITVLINCDAEANTGKGFRGETTQPIATMLISCSAFNNTAGDKTDAEWGRISNFTTRTVSAYTDPANGDFTPNLVDGGGHDLIGRGHPQGAPFTGATQMNPNRGPASNRPPTIIPGGGFVVISPADSDPYALGHPLE